VLKNNYGTDRKAYHLTADYTWGWSQEGSIKKYTEPIGWETVAAVRTPLGAGDFSQYITPVLNSGADVLVLNHYGKDMVNSLTQAVQFGLRDKQVNGKDFVIVVPLYSRLMAQGAGENVKGIFGSTNWHWSLQDEGSKAFVKSFGKIRLPAVAGRAHLLLPGPALRRCLPARRHLPPCGSSQGSRGLRVRRPRQRPDEYRAADHQCFKDVLVVKGKENPSSKFDLLEVVEVTPRAKVEYAGRLARRRAWPVQQRRSVSLTYAKTGRRFGPGRFNRRRYKSGSGRVGPPGLLNSAVYHGRNNSSDPERAGQGRRLRADRVGADARLRHAGCRELRAWRAVHARRLLRRDVQRAVEPLFRARSDAEDFLGQRR
jgi:hypothetical protein